MAYASTCDERGVFTGSCDFRDFGDFGEMASSCGFDVGQTFSGLSGGNNDCGTNGAT